MRLVGVLATCFVLLAALLYGFQHRDEIGLRLADHVRDMMPAEVAAVDAHDLPAATATEVAMPMREAGRLNGFTGFPGYARATFALPRSSTPRSGVLVLDLDGALETGARGLVRVTVNGVRRTELVLDEGRLRRRVMVPLNIRDLADRSVVVALSAEGQAPQADCSADWDGGIVTRIMPTSHVKLVLDAPLDDPADLLLANSAPLRLEWPAPGPLRARLLKAAHLRATAQDGLLFAPSGTGGLVPEDALLDALESLAAAAPAPRDDGRDLAAALGRKRSVAFEGEATWRMDFDRRRFEPGAAAAGLDLQMTYDAAGDDSGWLLSVRLNDRLVHSEALTGASGSILRTLALPETDQPMVNELRVTLTSAEQRSGRCAAARPATADIGMAHLTLATSAQDSAWAEIQGVLAGPLHLGVHPGLDASGAQLASDLLTTVSGGTALDLHVTLADPASLSTVTAVPLDALASFVAQVNQDRSWVVTPGLEEDSVPAITRVAEIDAAFLAHAPRAVLVVEAAPQYDSASVR